MVDNVSYDMYSAMQTGDPVASYIKKCIGKIQISVIDPFTSQVVYKLLFGDPYNSETDRENMIVDVWTEKENAFFKKAYGPELKKGNLMPYDRSQDKKAELAQKNWNVASDVELEKVLGEKYFTMKSILEKMSTVTVLNRLLNLARDLEKSEKLISAIQQRLSEIQMSSTVK